MPRRSENIAGVDIWGALFVTSSPSVVAKRSRRMAESAHAAYVVAVVHVGLTPVLTGMEASGTLQR